MPVFLLDVAGDVAGRAKMRPVVGLAYTQDEQRQIRESQAEGDRINAEWAKKDAVLKAQRSAPGYIDPSEQKAIRNQAEQLVAEVVGYNLGPNGQLLDGDLLNLARRMVGSAPTVKAAPVVAPTRVTVPSKVAPARVIKRVVKPIRARA